MSGQPFYRVPPRKSDVKAPMAAIDIQASMAKWKALVKTDAAEAEGPVRVRMMPACAPPSDVKMAPASATLNPWPTTRTVARKPEAIPKRFMGTEPMIALLFGAWKSACPKPAITSGQAMSNRDECCVRWPRNQRAAEAIANPIELSTREPNRSESQPLKGATTEMVRGTAVIIRPAFWGGMAMSSAGAGEGDHQLRGKRYILKLLKPVPFEELPPPHFHLKKVITQLIRKISRLLRQKTMLSTSHKKRNCVNCWVQRKETQL